MLFTQITNRNNVNSFINRISVIFQMFIFLNFVVFSLQSVHIQAVKSQFKNSHNNNLEENLEEFKNSSRETPVIGAVRGPPTKYSNRKRISVYFTPWTYWNQCDSECKQKRERYCVKKKKCGSTKHVEERSCSKSLCSTTQPNFQPIPNQSNSDQQTASQIQNTINILHRINNNSQNKTNKIYTNDYSNNHTTTDSNDHSVLKKRKNNKKKRKKYDLLDFDDDVDDNDDEYEGDIDNIDYNEYIIDKDNRDFSEEISKTKFDKNKTRLKINLNKKNTTINSVSNDGHADESIDDNREEEDIELDLSNDHKKLQVPSIQLDSNYDVILETVDFRLYNELIRNTNKRTATNRDFEQDSKTDDDQMLSEDDDIDSTESYHDSDIQTTVQSIVQQPAVSIITKNGLISKRFRERNVMDQALRYRRVYFRWSRWSKCSTKCTTRRFKRCRMKQICGNEVLRETAYCYVEGTFCQEWIKSQMHNINSGAKPIPRETYFTALSTTSTTTTTPAPPVQNYPSTYYNSDRRTLSQYQQPHHHQQISNNIDCDRRPVYTPQTLKCGIPARSRSRPNINNWLKIIGGKPAGKGQYPWQVAVLNKYKEVFCGGTLITPLWVLSAAHCVRRRLFLKIGVYNLNNTRDRNVLMVEVAMTIKHPEYNKRTVDNDIAMLKLPYKVTPRNNIGFACLPQRFQSLPFGSPCTIIGWGKMKNNDISGTNVLHAAEVPIISTEECKNVYVDYKITKNMFCAGHKRGRIDTCAGDSGGPILCRDITKSGHPWAIFGVTSFGDGCGKEDKFGIYTKLPNYVDWIWSVVNCNGNCNGNCKY